jgi:phosphatidate cytidylyltransferase
MADAKAARPSDLKVRTLTAIVMIAVAGSALWLGGPWWTIFVIVMAFGVLWEWFQLVRAFASSPMARGLWQGAGLIYIGVAAAMLLFLREDLFGVGALLSLIGAVVATDIGAYFMGRAIGGPKIAPSISPSKTWAGLLGGMIGATAVVLVSSHWGEELGEGLQYWLKAVLFGPLVAITAQAGDFFESWMKRRAGVKDSGRLLPGHGGLFDRIDGLLAVLFMIAVISCLYLVPAL